jgi:hypothetical protein
MFGFLALIFPQQAALLNFFLSFLPTPFHSRFCLFFIMDLSKYTECLSQWPAHIAPGLPTFGALFLLATGGLVIACKVWTFVRVLLSLFVLPGKPVWNRNLLSRSQTMKLTEIE